MRELNLIIDVFPPLRGTPISYSLVESAHVIILWDKRGFFSFKDLFPSTEFTEEKKKEGSRINWALDIIKGKFFLMRLISDLVSTGFIYKSTAL